MYQNRDTAWWAENMRKLHVQDRRSRNKQYNHIIYKYGDEVPEVKKSKRAESNCLWGMKQGEQAETGPGWLYFLKVP